MSGQPFEIPQKCQRQTITYIYFNALDVSQKNLFLLKKNAESSYHVLDFIFFVLLSFGILCDNDSIYPECLGIIAQSWS